MERREHKTQYIKVKSNFSSKIIQKFKSLYFKKKVIFILQKILLYAI